MHWKVFQELVVQRKLNILDQMVILDMLKDVVVKQAGSKNANVSGGMNEDKKEESARAHNRPSANATGDRT